MKTQSKSRRSWLAGSLVMLALAAAGEAAAEASVAEARQVVESLNASLLELMKRADALGYAGRATTIEPVVRESYDLSSMARIALGKHWRKLEADERERFVDLFARLTIANYAGRFDGYAGERFEVISEEATSQGLRLVRSRIVRSNQEAIAIDYGLRPIGTEFRIVDIYLGGTVSELALRRAEYTSLIDRKGYSALVAALEARIERLASGEDAGP